MTRNQFKDASIRKKSLGIRTEIGKIVLGRDGELAVVNGSWLHNLSPLDFGQARREEMREPDAGEEILESPDSEPWEPVP